MVGSQPRRTTRPPARALPGMTAGATARPLSGPRQDPCRGYGEALAKDSRRATIRPTPTPTSTTVRMQLPTQPAGQAPAWQDADLHGDPPLHHLSCLPAYMAQQAPRPDPCRSPGKALAEDTRRATIRPTPIKPPPPHACSCRPNQLGRHLCGGMQIFVKTHHCATSAACLPTWHHRRRWSGRVSTQEGAATDETGSSLIPDKARTHKQDALNAPCHVMRGITSHHCTLSTSCVPLWQPLFL